MLLVDETHDHEVMYLILLYDIFLCCFYQLILLLMHMWSIVVVASGYHDFAA